MARYVEYQKEMAYRYYLTDVVNLGNQGKYSKVRFADIDSHKVQLQEQRTGDEIAAEIISKAGLVVK
jgi:hypothetical protein